MKQVRSIGSLMMAALVLMASTHFFVDLHRCGDHVNAVSVLEKADGCGHSKMPPCHESRMKGCCSNEQIQHAGQELTKEITNLSLSATPFVAIEQHPVVLAQLISPVAIQSDSRFGDDPPPLSVDRQIRFSVFLI